jgi:SAM-dependent methyltransferase
MPSNRDPLAASAAARCPVCDSDAPLTRLLVKGGFDLYRCAACDHIVVHPVPSSEALARLYSFEGGYQTHAAQDGVPARAAHPKFVERIARIERHRAGGRLLDVGCSYGEFLGVARARGFDVQGVEMSPDTAALAAAQGTPVFVGSLADARFPDATFDIVHAGDVIEHLTDVRAFVAEIRRVLKPSGLIVVATPNHDAFFPRATLALYRVFRIPWSHATPPWHLHQFSARSLERLLAAHGFATLDVYHTGVALGYEVRATGSFSALKRALRARDALGMLRPGLEGCGALIAYPLVWLLDQVVASERRDATVNLIAEAR